MQFGFEGLTDAAQLPLSCKSPKVVEVAQKMFNDLASGYMQQDLALISKASKKLLCIQRYLQQKQRYKEMQPDVRKALCDVEVALEAKDVASFSEATLLTASIKKVIHSILIPNSQTATTADEVERQIQFSGHVALPDIPEESAPHQAPLSANIRHYLYADIRYSDDMVFSPPTIIKCYPLVHEVV